MLVALLALALGSTPEPSVEAELSHFRVRDPNRDLHLGFGPTLGDKVYATGSPGEAHAAPEFGARFIFGSWRYALLARGGVSAVLPNRKSIAHTKRGSLLEGVLAFRWMPVQRRRARFGLWLGFAFESLRTKVELDEADGGATGVKRAGFISPELGLELSIPVVLARADRKWSMDIFAAPALRLGFPTRSTLRFEDDDGRVEMSHRGSELTVLGPFGGAIISARLGITLHYDLRSAGN